MSGVDEITIDEIIPKDEALTFKEFVQFNYSV